MAGTFKSNDTPIAEILKDIARGANQLPDFQRGWVWDDEHIRALIASIYSAYPVGALMFLEYGGDTVRFKYRPFTGVSANQKPDILVLDGQQRLTSIFGAMFCERPVPTQTIKKEPIERYYYLDIVNCLKSLKDRTIDRLETILSVPADKTIRSDFGRAIDTDLRTREDEYKHQVFPLNIVFNRSETAKWRRGYNDYYKDDAQIVDDWDVFETEILDAIFTYNVPVITLNANTPKEAVCQVFENVNTGGISLTVFELVTATFAATADDFDLRGDWYGVDKKEDNGNINHIMGRYEKMQSKSDLLSAVSDVDFLVASTLLSRYYAKEMGCESAPAVSCKKQDVLDLSLADYNKYAADLTEGFIQVANFLAEQRIFSERDLPYTTQIIPFSVLFAILKQRAQNGTVRAKLAQWYWCGVFGEMYGAANETRYASDVTGVMHWLNGGVEPDTISRAYFQPKRLLSLQTRNSAAYKGVMALILKAKALDFVSGKEMDFTVFSGENIDIHHIFPRDYCEKRGLDRAKWNSIINKTPLSFRTNRIIGGNAPSVYLKKLEQSEHVTESDANRNVATHLINVDDLRADRFNEYFTKRAKALLLLIGSAMGKPVMNTGGEDVITAFGGTLE